MAGDTGSSSSKSKSFADQDDSFNGNITDKYRWSQTLLELDVKVPIDPSVKKGKEVKIDILTNHLGVWLVKPGGNELIFEGKLPFPVTKESCYWNLLPGECIQIFLEKAQERWWTALIEGEEPIDPKKIDPIKPMEDLEDDEHMKIQELMWNQDRKRKGLPTSEEMKMHDILKKAWDKEGSPFKGQPFDPSLVNFGSGPSPPQSQEPEPPLE